MRDILRQLRHDSISLYNGGDGWHMFSSRDNGYGLFPLVRSDYTNEDPLLNESNFNTALQRLVSVDSRTRTFHMSGFGGIDYIEVPLTPAIADEAQAIFDELKDYPILDEDDYSSLEWEDYSRQLLDAIACSETWQLTTEQVLQAFYDLDLFQIGQYIDYDEVQQEITSIAYELSYEMAFNDPNQLELDLKEAN